MEHARIDLAERLGTQPDVVEVVTVEAVTWPDGSLGCPQPGMAYTEMLVEGLRIQLAHDGTIYFYHSGGSEPPFFCDQPATLDDITPYLPDT